MCRKSFTDTSQKWRLILKWTRNVVQHFLTTRHVEGVKSLKKTDRFLCSWMFLIYRITMLRVSNHKYISYYCFSACSQLDNQYATFFWRLNPPLLEKSITKTASNNRPSDIFPLNLRFCPAKHYYSILIWSGNFDPVPIQCPRILLIGCDYCAETACQWNPLRRTKIKKNNNKK